MELKKEGFSVAVACRVLSLSRSSFYFQPKEKEEEELKTQIRKVLADWPTYGYRRVTHQLRRQDIVVNAKVILRLMRELGLTQSLKRSKKRTTNSNHPYRRYPNLVLELDITWPDQVWVGDITYVRVQYGHVYLAILMDVFTKAIRGWHLARHMTQELTLTALNRGLAIATPSIHHSDQGLQYSANAYVLRLQDVGVAISMAEVGQAWQNGYAERLLRTVHEEAVDLSAYRDYHDAYQQLDRFLNDVYMKKRIHSALGYLTPAEFEHNWYQQKINDAIYDNNSSF